MSKCLVAPLNWGLGHASRCVPVIHRMLDEGYEVILGGDGESLTLLRKHFPKLRYTYLSPLNLRYSKGKSQVFAMLRALPKLILWSYKDHLMLKALLREEHIDRVISDNRFGLYSKHSECIYITHQLHIMFPKGFKWLEATVSRFHARVYTHYNKVWVPDYEDPAKSLAGALSHLQISIFKFQIPNIEYIGPLSRFTKGDPRSGVSHQEYDAVAILSGPEPHRSLLENDILKRFAEKEEKVLVVQGLMNRPKTQIKRRNITIVPFMNDAELAAALYGAKHIIARSGYSTIMDLDALGLLHCQPPVTNLRLELLPTPGQPEQEYLAAFLAQKNALK